MSEPPDIIGSSSQEPYERLVAALQAIAEIISLDSVYCSRFQEQEGPTAEELRNEFRLYVMQIVDRIVELFGDYTGDKCAVCVKTFCLSEDHPELQDISNIGTDVELPFVRTFWRDRDSLEARTMPVDKDQHLAMYRHDENTGLTNANRIGYWYCNDLGKLGKSYRRSNKLWSSFYNATAIVSLAYRSEGHVMHPLGFLCVDNMKGGFDDRPCRYILETLANIIQYSMRMTLTASLRVEK